MADKQIKDFDPGTQAELNADADFVAQITATQGRKFNITDFCDRILPEGTGAPTNAMKAEGIRQLYIRDTGVLYYHDGTLAHAWRIVSPQADLTGIEARLTALENAGQSGGNVTPPTQHTVTYGLIDSVGDKTNEQTATLLTPPNRIDLTFPAPTTAFPNWYVRIPPGKTFSRMINIALRDNDVSDLWTIDFPTLTDQRVFDDTIVGVEGRFRLEVTG